MNFYKEMENVADFDEQINETAQVQNWSLMIKLILERRKFMMNDLSSYKEIFENQWKDGRVL